MRILVLNYEFPPLGGGAGNATEELVRALGDIGVLESVVVTSSLAGFEVDRSLAPNTTIYRLPIGKQGGDIHYQTQSELLRYNVQCHRFLRGLLRRERFDICHAVMGVPGGINAWLMRKRLPYIVSLQGSDVPGFSERFGLLYKVLTPVIQRIWRDAHAVVANSWGLRAMALESTTEEVGVIPNGINRTLFHPRDSPGWSGDKRRIVCVGRLIERKGSWELLSALPAVIAAIPNAHLDLVGTGDLREALDEAVESQGLADRVTLHGPVPHDEVGALLQDAALFALPSHAEGMSNALLEGMACGLPVVTTDTGGTSELVHGNGLVVPPRDPEALARAIIEILSDEARWLKMRRRSLEIARSYSWASLAQDYVKLYEQALRIPS